MRQINRQPPRPALAEDVQVISGALVNLKLKGKQQQLTLMLLEAANKASPTISESEILSRLYGGEGVANSHKKSLGSLALEIKRRLAKLPVDGLAVSCESAGLGKTKSWYLRIEPANRTAPAVGFALPSNTLEKIAKPEFSWGGPGISRRSREVWLPVHGDDTEFTFRIESKSWKEPAGFGGYVQHRDQSWREYEAKYRNCPNPRVWHVAGFTQKNDRHGAVNRAIELNITPIYFNDVVATTFRLKKEIDGANGKASIHDWLASGAQPRTGSCHFVPAGNPLLVETNVITSDGKLVVRQHHDRQKNETRWESAIFGYVDSLMDVFRNALHLPDPSETVFRKSCQLLGMSFQPARVRWLGVGFGLVEGKVSLLGEVEIGLTAAEFLQYNGDRRVLKMLEITPSSIHKFCTDNRVRGHFEALLALSLKRRTSRVTVTTNVSKQR